MNSDELKMVLHKMSTVIYPELIVIRDRLKLESNNLMNGIQQGRTNLETSTKNVDFNTIVNYYENNKMEIEMQMNELKNTTDNLLNVYREIIGEYESIMINMNNMYLSHGLSKTIRDRIKTNKLRVSLPPKPSKKTKKNMREFMRSNAIYTELGVPIYSENSSSSSSSSSSSPSPKKKGGQKRRKY